VLSVRHTGVLLLACVMPLSACANGDDDDFPDVPGFEGPTTPTADVVGGETPQPFTLANAFPAGDAGEVELDVDDDQLVLVEVRPDNDWTYRVEEDEDDEIQIDFLRNGSRIDFEATIDDTRLEVDVCTDVLQSVNDVYTLNEAGEVEARLVGDELELVQVRPAEGWIHEVEEGDEEIEVVFGRGDLRVTFDLEVENGSLDAMTCTRTIVLRGPNPTPVTTETINVVEDDDDDDGNDD
jgi:hypothetical protein